MDACSVCGSECMYDMYDVGRESSQYIHYSKLEYTAAVSLIFSYIIVKLQKKLRDRGRNKSWGETWSGSILYCPLVLVFAHDGSL